MGKEASGDLTVRGLGCKMKRINNIGGPGEAPFIPSRLLITTWVLTPRTHVTCNRYTPTQVLLCATNRRKLMVILPLCSAHSVVPEAGGRAHQHDYMLVLLRAENLVPLNKQHDSIGPGLETLGTKTCDHPHFEAEGWEGKPARTTASSAHATRTPTSASCYAHGIFVCLTAVVVVAFVTRSSRSKYWGSVLQSCSAVTKKFFWLKASENPGCN